jgi:pyruvate formate lyase activating enzyme
VVDAAKRSGSSGIAYTYNEPLVEFEFVEDCAGLAREAGLFNVLVTNGYLCPEPAAELLPLIDALNIDVKSMDDAFYRRYCAGRLQPVLDVAVAAVKTGCHVELTNLIIPGLNDDDAGFVALAEWAAGSLGQATPLHLSAYRPQYKMDLPATPAALLQRARELCSRSLWYVYLGNVWTAEGTATTCPQCGATLIDRQGYAVTMKGIVDGCCRQCGRPADVHGS